MHSDRHYTEPRLAAIYDVECAGREDIEFYLSLATELGARRVVDLGCGTGVLATDLAAAGRFVTAVDPAWPMLDVARNRPGGERVAWIYGDASALPAGEADLAVMSGHAAQVFLDDAEWAATLGYLRRTLRLGGHLCFEVRNPAAEGWRSWTRERTTSRYCLPSGEQFESWVQVTRVDLGSVTFDGVTVFDSDGARFVSESTLRFRTRAELGASLLAADFEIVAVYGDWDRSSVADASPELIFLARAA